MLGAGAADPPAAWMSSGSEPSLRLGAHGGWARRCSQSGWEERDTARGDREAPTASTTASSWRRSGAAGHDEVCNRGVQPPERRQDVAQLRNSHELLGEIHGEDSKPEYRHSVVACLQEDHEVAQEGAVHPGLEFGGLGQGQRHRSPWQRSRS